VDGTGKMNSLEFYEHKVISDPEFPMQIFENHGEKKGEYFRLCMKIGVKLIQKKEE